MEESSISSYMHIPCICMVQRREGCCQGKIIIRESKINPPLEWQRREGCRQGKIIIRESKINPPLEWQRREGCHQGKIIIRESKINPPLEWQHVKKSASAGVSIAIPIKWPSPLTRKGYALQLLRQNSVKWE